MLTRLPKSIWEHCLIPLLGRVAPELAGLAQCSKDWSQWARSRYCVRCGLLFLPSDHSRREMSGGWVEHAHQCEWPLELDPWRDFYPRVDWKISFVAGGWAAFLHFHEHRRCVRPWRPGGEVSQRDLDLFFCRHGRSDTWYLELQMSYHWNIVELERPSEWSEKTSQKEWPQHLNAKIRVPSPRGADFTGPCIDIIGKLARLGAPRCILDTFDLPPTRVGFQWPNLSEPRGWILHPHHTESLCTPMDAQSREAREKALLESYPGMSLAVARETVANQLHYERRRQERVDKYMQRGYAHGGGCGCPVAKPCKRPRLTQ